MVVREDELEVTFVRHRLGKTIETDIKRIYVVRFVQDWDGYRNQWAMPDGRINVHGLVDLSLVS
ncbi:hypothetical protein PAMC26510_08395 [Caballeronia sordidicola]|uniref:Uncharacterized protein n=1 Tax=Caballeronia sordidicola TaxID=196367 RepID=A0A242N1X1_CABSO|nr:hypothetical protein PAMC26510_08395 [Caballeronia sordidicola]